MRSRRNKQVETRIFLTFFQQRNTKEERGREEFYHQRVKKNTASANGNNNNGRSHLKTSQSRFWRDVNKQTERPRGPENPPPKPETCPRRDLPPLEPSAASRRVRGLITSVWSRRSSASSGRWWRELRSGASFIKTGPAILIWSGLQQESGYG